jgi:hypothetical protein
MLAAAPYEYLAEDSDGMLGQLGLALGTRHFGTDRT